MPGEWKPEELPRSDPFIKTPEAHWLRTVLQIGGTWALSIEVDKAQAVNLKNALLPLASLGSEPGDKRIWLRTEDNERLESFIGSEDDVSNLRLEIFADLTEASSDNNQDVIESISVLDGVYVAFGWTSARGQTCRSGELACTIARDARRHHDNCHHR